jgi:hypothetical protein
MREYKKPAHSTCVIHIIPAHVCAGLSGNLAGIWREWPAYLAPPRLAGLPAVGNVEKARL